MILIDSNAKPWIAVSMGDPAGVGPELCLALLNDKALLALARPLIVGDVKTLLRVAERTRWELSAEVLTDLTEVDRATGNSCILDLAAALGSHRVVPGVAHAKCAQAAVTYIRSGVELCLQGRTSALVTAPINKHALNMAGIDYPGHTELIAELTDSPDYAMLMYSQAQNLAVAFVTCHCSLRSIPQQLDQQRIVQVTSLLQRYLQALTGNAHPRLAVLGLNPHAGEEGLFGDEEQRHIVPAIASLQSLGIDAQGPVVPDAAFTRYGLSRYDGFVAMYHDQGNIPFKLLAFDSGVNMTMGIKIIRTSPDHGTAYDIAWQRKADPSSFAAAYTLAARIAKASGERRSLSD